MDALKRLIDGDAGHYPLGTIALAVIDDSTEHMQSFGFFPIPPDVPTPDSGVTLWMPYGLAVVKRTPHPAAARAFLDFATSEAGCDIIAQHHGDFGLPVTHSGKDRESTLLALQQLKHYAAQSGTTVALEFLSPIKGPSLEVILVRLAKGEITALEAARLYDRDLKRRALELDLQPAR